MTQAPPLSVVHTPLSTENSAGGSAGGAGGEGGLGGVGGGGRGSGGIGNDEVHSAHVEHARESQLHLFDHSWLLLGHHSWQRASGKGGGEGGMEACAAGTTTPTRSNRNEG